MLAIQKPNGRWFLATLKDDGRYEVTLKKMARRRTGLFAVVGSLAYVSSAEIDTYATRAGALRRLRELSGGAS